MSTQDDSIYLRSRIAERRGKPDYGGPGGQWSSPPQFTKDGYVKWAESTRPAREGGAEKIGCEKQMPRKGAGIVDDISKFVGLAREYAPKVKATLRDPTVQNAIAKGKYAPTMNKVADYMELVGLGHMKHDAAMVRRVGGSKSFKDYCGGRIGMGEDSDSDSENEGGRIGMGRGGRIGMGELKALEGAGFVEDAKKAYDWLKANGKTIKTVLNSKFLNENLGTDVPKKIAGYMGMVGLGHGGKMPEFEACPPGYVDDGFTCRKPIKMTTRKQKHAFGEFDVPHAEGGEIIAKTRKGGISFASMKKAASQAHDFGKKHGSTMKSLAREYGGEYGAKAADLATKAGYGRTGGTYAQFVKQFAAQHPGPDLMRRAAAAWRSR